MSTLGKLVRRAASKFQQDVAVIMTTGRAVGDRNDESTYVAGTETRHIEKGLLTYAAAAQDSLRGWMSQVNCDLIIDFLPEADLSGDVLRFLVNGEEYAPKATGAALPDFFTWAGEEQALRTVALARTGRIEGRIRFASSTEKMDLFHYDLEKRSFSWTNGTMPIGRGEFLTNPGDGNLLEVEVGGTTALAVDAGGNLVANDIVSTGLMTVAPLPRLEFYAGQSQVAALTGAGVLYVRGFTASAAMPVGRKDEIEFFGLDGTTWLFGLRSAGLFAPGIRQGL